jgi:excisionase family DNA binding protein
MDELWDVVRLSQYLGIEKSTLYAMIERKETPHYRIGKLARFRWAEIDEWLLAKKCHNEQERESRRTHRRLGASSPASIVQAAIDQVNPQRYSRRGKSGEFEQPEPGFREFLNSGGLRCGMPEKDQPTRSHGPSGGPSPSRPDFP